MIGASNFIPETEINAFTNPEATPIDKKFNMLIQYNCNACFTGY